MKKATTKQNQCYQEISDCMKKLGVLKDMGLEYRDESWYANVAHLENKIAFINKELNILNKKENAGS